jgi:hypothetical protein
MKRLLDETVVEKSNLLVALPVVTFAVVQWPNSS